MKCRHQEHVMKTKHLKIGIVCVCAAIGIFGLRVGVIATSNGIQPTVSELKSQDGSQRKAAAQSILDNRLETIESLEVVAKDAIPNQSQNPTATAAVRLLGAMRAREAVPFLIGNITFTDAKYAQNRMTGVEEHLPCVGALIGIGEPSLDPLLKKAEASNNEKISQITALVLFRILDKNVAIFAVQDRLKHVSDAKAQDSLRRVLEVLGTIPDNTPSEE